MLFLAALLLDAPAREPAELIADTIRLQEIYKKCLTEQTVKLGQGNSESAETILRGVSAVCLPIEAALRADYAQSPLPSYHVAALMERDRKLGEDAGVAALLQARASRP